MLCIVLVYSYLCKTYRITEDMNITRNIHKSLIYRELLPPPQFAYVVIPQNIFFQARYNLPCPSEVIPQAGLFCVYLENPIAPG